MCLSKNNSLRVFLIVVGLCVGTQAFPNYTFNDLCHKAYSRIISLDFVGARALLNEEKHINPDNLIVPFLENASDFLAIVVSEDEKLYNTLKSNRDSRITVLEGGDKNSPYYRYCLAEVYLHWAAVGIIFGEYVTSAYDINKAYRLLKRNNEDFPSFVPNFKSLGLLNALIGSIPDNYKWVGRIIGVESTVEEGANQLAIVLRKSLTDSRYTYLKAESVFFLAYVTINLENSRENVEKLIRLAEADTVLQKLANTSAPVNFGLANLYLRSKKDADKGIRLLESLDDCSRCAPFAYRYFALGLAKLNRLDDDADTNFAYFLKITRGRNFIKAAWQKRAWYRLILNDTQGYRQLISKALSEGYAETDDDKMAFKEAQNGEMPDVTLLRARLLFDGGYFSRALGELQSIDPQSRFPAKKDFLEYHYRLARIYHEKGDTSVAIPLYYKTIKEGEDETWYYAANASLQLALIYESRSRNELARDFFEKALKMQHTEYRNSINQKAKAGLNRLKNNKE